MTDRSGTKESGSRVDQLAAAEERGRQRGRAEAIADLRDQNKFMRWLIDYQLEHPDNRRHSCELHADYLEAKGHQP